ncbi:hypothetical protein INR49_013882, partial [Caranx melampygus]
MSHNEYCQLSLFDTDRPQDKVKEDFVTSISLAAPGPHAFLVVIHLDRFTEEEQQTVKVIQNVFGEEAAHYSMVLFTRGDDLKADGVSIEDFISKNKNLRNFVRQCYGGYHVFNNRDDDPSQVRELLKKINKMVRENGGSYYTNEMFKENERAIKEEMEHEKNTAWFKRMKKQAGKIERGLIGGAPDQWNPSLELQPGPLAQK